MENQDPNKASGRMDYDLDILNDSISINMVDDSFEYGNDTTFVLPSKPTGRPSSSSSRSRQKKTTVSSRDSHVHQEHHNEEGEAQPGPSWTPQNDHDKKLSDHSTRRQVLRNLELEKERDWLRDINKLLLNSADQMDTVKEKLENVQSATQTSHELLDLYSKILTQTEHTKDLLSNPEWKGLSDDMERRAQIKEQERLRLARERELEEAEERERLRKQQEAEAEAERSRQLMTKSTRGGSSIPTKNFRGRGSTSAGRSTAGRSIRGQSRIGRITR